MSSGGVATSGETSPLTVDTNGGDSSASSFDVGMLLQQHALHKMHVSALESQLSRAMQERKAAEAAHAVIIQRLEEEIRRLEKQAEEEIGELSRRQEEVERQGMAARDQLRQLKSELTSTPFVISEKQYEDLLAMPEEQRSLREQVMLVIFERMCKQKMECQKLSEAQELAMEELSKATVELQRVRRELQRKESIHELERREAEQDLMAMAARVERLEKELNESMIQVEVLGAKGALFDEMKEKADDLECQKTAMMKEKAAMAETLKSCSEERDEAVFALKEKEHTIELLSMDKTYLQNEIQSQNEQIRKLEDEGERLREKLHELKKSRQDLLDRLLGDKQDNHAAQEERLLGEIARLEERAKKDLEAVRKEAMELAEREIQTLKDLHASALLDVDRLQMELRDGKATYEQLFLKYRELQSTSAAQQGELRAELKLKGFELDHLRAVNGESAVVVKQTKLQNEMLNAKVKVLMENYHALDAEKGKQIAELQADLHIVRGKLREYDTLEKDIDDTITHSGAAAGMTSGSINDSNQQQQGFPFASTSVDDLTILGGGGGVVPTLTSLRRRIQYSLQLAKDCAVLRKQVEELEAKLQEEQRERKQSELELGAARQRLQLLEQPQSYLLTAVQQAESEARKVRQEGKILQQEVKKANDERDRLQRLFDEMRQDMQQLLEERRSLEELHQLLSSQESPAASSAVPIVNVG